MKLESGYTLIGEPKITFVEGYEREMFKGVCVNKKGEKFSCIWPDTNPETGECDWDYHYIYDFGTKIKSIKI